MTVEDAAYLAGVLDSNLVVISSSGDVLVRNAPQLFDQLALIWGGSVGENGWYIPAELAPSVVGSARPYMLTNKLPNAQTADTE